jgi:hypothetical protein
LGDILFVFVRVAKAFVGTATATAGATTLAVFLINYHFGNNSANN